MADIRKIKLPNGNTYDIVPNLKPFVHDWAAIPMRLQANKWHDETLDKDITPGTYLVSAYARMEHSGAASRVIELTNSNGSRISYSTSARTSGSGNGTVDFCTVIYVTSTIANPKLRIQCGTDTTGTYVEYEISMLKIGE
jgi:hypothetical protein